MIPSDLALSFGLVRLDGAFVRSHEIGVRRAIRGPRSWIVDRLTVVGSH